MTGGTLKRRVHPVRILWLPSGITARRRRRNSSVHPGTTSYIPIRHLSVFLSILCRPNPWDILCVLIIGLSLYPIRMGRVRFPLPPNNHEPVAQPPTGPTVPKGRCVGPYFGEGVWCRGSGDRHFLSTQRQAYSGRHPCAGLTVRLTPDLSSLYSLVCPRVEPTIVRETCSYLHKGRIYGAPCEAEEEEGLLLTTCRGGQRRRGLT